ncbi:MULTISPECIES: phosphoribosylglycinamide formyltransferase [Sutcliffiella]|uniref:Phosphoribosylglycinamide formyltransferase n=1 Tax=Sutcliffiella cohnii TaxID=33932 RepID=A0A223KKA5_9BACI|nr:MULTISPECIES: phosphoribosylglycinamide formyltransferase [Sutcliffiella]AST89793.1 phosphoribosylglycinamide formyltransferase [Sutcliffiella cohnii]MED4018146.1 phosphoribosylglycinamide formyltransferase [Sutcliffiella cohnii]WBL15419.1 phosphoribosylglycinamide formyltransferase [Sutcliffiella sp. NC1]
MIKMAIFASGSGSNFRAIVEACRNGSLEAVPTLLVCDKQDAKVVERANEENIPTFVFSPKEYESKVAFENAILHELRAHNIEWIVLAGYMRLIGATLLSAYPKKIVNVHPSLLPDFPGLDAVGQALKEGVGKTGVTIHFVDEGMDTGPIIAQGEVEILPFDTRETLQQRIQQLEHELYPKTLQNILHTERSLTKR